MSNKTTTKVAKLDVFKCDIVLIVCESKNLIVAASKILSEAHLKKFKAMLPDDLLDNPSREGSNYPIMGGGSIIWCKPEAKPSVLVHELAHALFYAMSEKSIALSPDTEEVYAYCLESLYTQFLEKSRHEK